MKLFYLLTVLFILNISAESISQTASYDIVIAGRTVGFVKVLQIDSSSEQSRLRIDAGVSIPFYTGSLQSENHFLKGSLKSAVADYRVNGKTKEKTVTSRVASALFHIDYYRSGKTYQKRKEVLHGIGRTIVSLYYQEPLNVDAVYSEKYGKMCQVVKLENSRYAVTMPSGKKNIYTYAGGKCNEVSVELGGFKLQIIRREIAAIAKK